VCFNDIRNVGKDISGRLPAGLDPRQHRLKKAATALALSAGGQLPPNHCMPRNTYFFFFFFFPFLIDWGEL
jgi:hypothetical protein